MFCTVISLEACDCLSLSQQIKAAKPFEQKSCINGFILSLADLFNLFRSNCDSQKKQEKPKQLFFTARRKWPEWAYTHTNPQRQKGFCGRKGKSTVLKVSHDSKENMLWEELYSVMTAKITQHLITTKRIPVVLLHWGILGHLSYC